MKLAVTQNATALIAEAEGFDTPGSWPGARSGVTIGVGYDLGYYPERVFRDDWDGILLPPDIDRLATAIGVTGVNAKAYCHKFGNIQIPHDGALRVFRTVTLPDFAQRAGNTFPGAENLPADAQGALVSLVFNRGTDLEGDRRAEMLNIRNAIKNSKADPGESEEQRVNNLLKYIAKEFRSMKRIWKNQGLDGLLTRRENEAKLVESCIT
jgi:hypothetical protein